MAHIRADEIHDHIIQTIEAGGGVTDAAAEYDIDAIQAAAFEYTPGPNGGFQPLPGADFWEIVQSHALTPAPESADPRAGFEADVLGYLESTPVSGVMRWVGEDGYEVEAVGVPRLGRLTGDEAITIVTPTGVRIPVRGASSWRAVWSRLEDARETSGVTQDQAAHRIAATDRAVRAAEAALLHARSNRAHAMREGVAVGITPYRIAKNLGYTDSGVKKMMSHP